MKSIECKFLKFDFRTQTLIVAPSFLTVSIMTYNNEAYFQMYEERKKI